MATDDRPSRKKKPATESLLTGAKERAKNALITGTAGGYLGGMLIEGNTRVKIPGRLTRKLMGMGKRRKTIGVHGARSGALVGALIGAANRGPRSETADAIATGGDWKFEDGKPTRAQSAAIGAAVPLAGAGLVLGTKGGRNLLRGLLSKVDKQDPRRLRKMGLQQKRKEASVRRAGEKAVVKAREQFRAEAMPKPPKDPTLGDAVKTVAKRTKRKVVKAVSNIGAGAETAFSAYIEDMTFSSLPKEVQKDVLRFVDAQKGTPVVHYGMTVKELIAKADPENLKAARKALGTLRASRAAAEVLGRVKDGSKYILLMNDRIVDGHHFLAKAERGQVTSSLNVLDLTPARLETRLSAGERLLWQFAEETQKKPGMGRKAAIAGGLGVAAAGAGLLPGAVPMLRLQGRRLLAKHTGKKSATFHGENVADYLDASQGALNRGVHGKIAGKVLQHAQKNPNSKLHKKLGRYGVDHFARFRAGTKEALGHWDYEVDANLKNKGLKRMRDSLSGGRKRVNDAINEQLWKHGKNESEALRAVAKNSDKDVQDYFRHLSRSKDKVYGGYAKKAALAPALVAAGGATAAVAARKPKERKMSAIEQLWQFAPGDRAMHALRGLRLVSQAQRAAIRKKPLTHLKPFTPREELPRIQKNLRDNAAAKLKWLRAGKPADQLRWFEFEEPTPRERRNRVRDLRDRIGLAKDVAGLGAVTAGTVGGVKLYRAAQAGIKDVAPHVKASARAWGKAAIRSRKAATNIADAAAIPSAITRGGKKMVQGIKKAATMWMHGDPRPVQTFARRQPQASPQPPEKRGTLQKVRDASLAAGGLTVAGAGAAALLKGREVGQVTDNIRNTTAVGADVGRVYRKARGVVTDSVQAGKEGFRDAVSKPAPLWAKRVVRAGKKLRIMEAGRSARAPLNEFNLGLLLTGVGTLAGSAAGNKFRYPVQNWLKKKAVPKLGRKWGRRVARAGAYLPENAGGLAGGVAGSILGGGIRQRQQADMAALNLLLHEFGGNDQIQDLDNSRFVDPFKKWLRNEKGYKRQDVTDYHRLRRRLLGRDLKPEQVKKIKDAMADIRDNRAVEVAGGQVLHSALRKADTVRRVTERGSGIVRDAVKAARGEAREKDRWGREKKREWEKPWFQRRRNQLLATGGLLAAGYLGRHTKVGARAVRKGEEVVDKARGWANKKLTNLFPDEGTDAAKAVRNARATGKPQSTADDILRETEAQAKAIREQAKAAVKPTPSAKPKASPALQVVKKPAASPAPKQAPAKKAPVLKTAPPVPVKVAASKPSKPAAPAPKPGVKPAPKPQVPPKNTQPLPGLDPQQAPSPWGASKIANEPKPLTAAEKLAKPKPKGRGKNQLAAALDLLWQFAEKPFDGYSPKRHARTGGLNDSFRKSYNREHGANLKRPVTTKPSKLKAGSKAAGRRKSFCARMGGMPGATSKGGKLTPKGAALRRWNCAARQVLTQFADPLDVGWDLRDARGRSARVFAPDAGQRERRPKRWHERVENERKLWAAAGLAGSGIGVAATRKLMGRTVKSAVDSAVRAERGKVKTALQKVRKLRAERKTNIIPMRGPSDPQPFRAA